MRHYDLVLKLCVAGMPSSRTFVLLCDEATSPLGAATAAAALVIALRYEVALVTEPLYDIATTVGGLALLTAVKTGRRIIPSSFLVNPLPSGITLAS